MALLQKNIGTRDKVARGVIALLLFILAYAYSSWILLAFALFTVFEVLFSWCIFYQVIGRNTCPLDTKKPKE